MKIALVRICNLQGKMSDAARIEIQELGVDAVFAFLSNSDIERWIRNNDDMNVYSFHEFTVLQLLLSNADVRLIKEINALSKKHKAEFQFTCDVWAAALKVFFRVLENPNTLRSLVKYYEVGRIAQAELTNTKYSLMIDQDSEVLGKMLRQRLKEVAGEQRQESGAIVAGTLVTRLTPDQWTTIIAELSMTKYLHIKYLDNPRLITDWMAFAYSFEKATVLRSSFSDKLQWEGTPRSLAEFLRKFRAVDAIDYSLKNKQQLYNWIARCITFRGNRNSLLTYVKSKTLKSDCFTITHSNSSGFQFEVNYPARKVKNS